MTDAKDTYQRATPHELDAPKSYADPRKLFLLPFYVLIAGGLVVGACAIIQMLV